MTKQGLVEDYRRKLREKMNMIREDEENMRKLQERVLQAITAGCIDGKKIMKQKIKEEKNE